jgi:putative transposase
MIVFEFKAKGTKQQYQKIDQAIRITQFIRNKCLRFWMDNQNVKYYDLNKYTAVLANEFDFADKLNSMARQAAAERPAFAIKRFFDNCKAVDFGFTILDFGLTPPSSVELGDFRLAILD